LVGSIANCNRLSLRSSHAAIAAASLPIEYVAGAYLVALK
jgi:hypothetical protein